ncbi:MAG: OsmC family protein [Actinomycetota bacterium]|nr:OsmC family protein [Actinomycetota bacterium]
MAVRKANAEWSGNLADGKGNVEVESGIFKSSYSFQTRFGEEKGTNPEELIGAAHSACYSMALSFILEQNNFKPEKISTEASVHIDKIGDGFKITKIFLDVKGMVPGIDKEEFLKYANEAKTGCPVSQALAATPIEMKAELL